MQNARSSVFQAQYKSTWDHWFFLRQVNRLDIPDSEPSPRRDDRHWDNYLFQIVKLSAVRQINAVGGHVQLDLSPDYTHILVDSRRKFSSCALQAIFTPTRLVSLSAEGLRCEWVGWRAWRFTTLLMHACGDNQKE
jgi:hypothetical protein